MGVFYTATESGGGAEREGDPDYRTAIRGKAKTRGEATWAGIENLIKTITLDSGNRIRVCKIFEDFVNKTVKAVVDDGSGDASLIGPIDTTTYPRASFPSAGYWEYTESHTNIYVQLPYKHIPSWVTGGVGDADIKKSIAGGAFTTLTYGTHYWVDMDTGLIALAVALNPTDRLRVWFIYYTELIARAAEKVNGVVHGTVNERGWRPVGQSITIRGPSNVTKPSVSASMKFKEGEDSQFGRELGATLVLSYLNGLNIGEAAKINQIGAILANVPGVESIENLLLNGGTSDVAAAAYDAVIRGDAATITV
jgi:hypothetical protein